MGRRLNRRQRHRSQRGSFADRLTGLGDGDPTAFEWVWERFAGEIRGFLLARGTPDADAVVNDVFLAVFTNVSSFAGSESEFRSWLFQVARNKRIDSIRRHSRDRSDPVAAAPEQATGDVEAEVIAGLEDTELRVLLAGLTTDQRDVIVLRFLSELSLAETANVLDKPVGAVKALQHRAVAQLRKTSLPGAYPDHRQERSHE